VRAGHARFVVPLLAGAALIVAVGCEIELAAEEEVALGLVGLHCRHGEIELSDVAFTLVRGGRLFRTGAFEPQETGTGFMTTIGPIPVDNYAINLTADARRDWNNQSTPCTGAASFGVLTNQTTAVAVTLRCLGLASDTGEIGNECPTIDSLRAVPREAELGQTVTLDADAEDPDGTPMPLVHRWTSTTGTISDSGPDRALFQCERPGKAAITLGVSDGDGACAEENMTVYVHCRERTGGETAGAGGAPGGCSKCCKKSMGGAGTAGMKSCSGN
jgi:hypothetical protein